MTEPVGSFCMLSPEQRAVLIDSGTERPFSSPLNQEKRRGTFVCAACNTPLYPSSTKFDSGTGWPSFWQAIENGVTTHTDRTHGMERTEVRCKTCDGHLGHVFKDGPPPTGLRYCMNGLAMKFVAEEEKYTPTP